MKTTHKPSSPSAPPSLLRVLAFVPPLALAAACATPPKPRELDAFETLKKSAGVADAAKRSPDLVASSDRLGNKAHDEWQSNDLEESRRDALMAQIKLKTALALLEQEQSKARIQALSREQADAEEELASVSKDLAAVTEQLTLMKKLVEARKVADADKQRLSQQMSSEQQKAEAEQKKLQDEQRKLTVQLATEQKLAAAQLALRTADTVEAGRYAKLEYTAATDMLAKAQAEIEGGNLEGAQASADVARQSAERAALVAKPAYEQAEQATQNRARDEALQRDATTIKGVAVRIERRGDLQRLVISLEDVFAKRQTGISTGRDGTVDAVAGLINKYPSYPVQVVGHTDSHGKPGELLALSAARAQTIVSALAARGVDAKRLLSSGTGADEPIADNKSAAGRAKNNRVEIIFLYH
jgi:outer membrane protein OmpA-like peptidoglycan-associated protein